MEKTDVPGVYRRGGRYVYSYRKRGRQRWGTAATKKDAKRLKRNAETDVERGEHREVSSLAFGEYARQWISTYHGRTSRGFRDSTRAWYREMLEQRLIPYFDHERGLRLSEIEPRDVKALVGWLVQLPHPRISGRKLARSTISGHVAVIRALFADAVEEGLLRFNPASGIRVAVARDEASGHEQSTSRRALTQPELARMLGEIPERWQLFFQLLTQTGLRIGEAVELRWDDVRFGERPGIEVRRQFVNGNVCAPKSRSGSRDVPLSPGLAQRLWQVQGPAGELVFTTARGGRVNRHNLYRDVLGPARKRAGVPWASLHTFRHTCASMLFASSRHGGGGKNLKQVQEWLGHHDPGFTLQTYVHLLEDGVGSADFFDALLEPPAGSVGAAAAQSGLSRAKR